MTRLSTATGDSTSASNLTTTVSQAARTSSANSLAEPAPTWLNIKLPHHDAVAYLQSEIYDWFHEQGVDIQKKLDRQELEAHKVKHKYVPWYRGGWDGVPIHKAVKFHYEFWRESFRLNPYGLSHGWYLFILLSQLCFLLGNLLVGTADGVLGARKGERHAWVSVVRGGVASLPIVWMFTLFLYPPLIANVKDQFSAMGHEYDDE